MMNHDWKPQADFADIEFTASYGTAVVVLDRRRSRLSGSGKLADRSNPQVAQAIGHAIAPPQTPEATYGSARNDGVAQTGNESKHRRKTA